ncbi:MAG TPA: PQQ-dependent sugar dehydrogenase, partial [Chitinophagaceae bacterium]|nr:PQQ-dependent sugar dehydrogenase [Chitinophagaceae bacterium]
FTSTDASNITYINIARYQTRADNPNLADDTSRKMMLSIAKPVGLTNHNGGRLQFGPDGALYFATGDGGGAGDPGNNAQNGASLLGKMIRLNVNTGATAYTAPYYTIPADNPYVSDGGVRDEIFALGLRNPFRWSFDRLTGDMWIGDVGQDAREEINFRAAGPPSGANYGWRCYEGLVPFNTSGCAAQSSYVSPIYDYPNPTPGAAAITGGHVYRGAEYPAMYGVYISSDVYSGNHYLTRSNGSGGWSTTVQPGLATGIVAFGEAEDGSIYAVNLFGGSISEVITTTGLPLRLSSFDAVRRTDHVEVIWKTSYEQDVDGFQVEFSQDGLNYNTASVVAATNDPNGSLYSIKHFSPLTGTVYYRLRITNRNGVVEYSPVVTTGPGRNTTGATVPSTVRNNRMLITFHEPYTQLRLLTPQGQTLLTRNVEGMTGVNEITLPNIPAGVYVVHLMGRGKQFTGRIVVAR